MVINVVGSLSIIEFTELWLLHDKFVEHCTLTVKLIESDCERLILLYEEFKTGVFQV